MSIWSRISPLRLIDLVNDMAEVQQNFREIREAIDSIDGRLGVPIGAIIPWCPPAGSVIPDDIPDRFGLADGVGNASGSGIDMLERYLHFGIACDVRNAERTRGGGAVDIVLETQIPAACTGASQSETHCMIGCSLAVCTAGPSAVEIFPLCSSDEATTHESTHKHNISATCHTHNLSGPSHSHEMTHVRRVVLIPIERLS